MRSAKNCHVVASFVQHGTEDVFQKRLREIRVGGEIGECDLGLHHPELREMTAGVTVLGAKRRTERVDLRQRQAVRLDVELAADGEECLLAEEVLAEIRASIRRFRNRCEIRQIERADAEHLACALGIAGRDDGCVHPVEAVLVKVAMDGHAQTMPHARHRAQRVRSRPEMGDLAEVFERCSLLLDWIPFRVVHPPDHVHRLGVELDGLSLALTLRQHARGRNGAPRRQLLDLAVVVGQRVGRHDLERVEARSVVQMNEGKSRLGVAACANPATDTYTASGRCLSFQHRRDIDRVGVSHFSKGDYPPRWRSPVSLEGFPRTCDP